MTQKRALVSGRIDKARGINELSGGSHTIEGETDSEFNGSVLHCMARALIRTDERVYLHDGTVV